jgi:tetratricopeptide (TPR) repeat protein
VTQTSAQAPRQPGWNGHLCRAKHQLADYSTAIRLTPSYGDAYYNRGTYYYFHGQYTLAVRDLTASIHLKCACQGRYFYRAQAELALHQPQPAISDFTRYIDQTARTECGTSCTRRGDAYYDLGEYVQAVADYQQAIAIGKATGWALEGLKWGAYEYEGAGMADYHLSKYAPAITALTAAIGLDPTDARAYLYRGAARWGSGDHQDAVSDEQGDTATEQQGRAQLQQMEAAMALTGTSTAAGTGTPTATPSSTPTA